MHGKQHRRAYGDGCDQQAAEYVEQVFIMKVHNRNMGIPTAG